MLGWWVQRFLWRLWATLTNWNPVTPRCRWYGACSVSSATQEGKRPRTRLGAMEVAPWFNLMCETCYLSKIWMQGLYSANVLPIQSDMVWGIHLESWMFMSYKIGACAVFFHDQLSWTLDSKKAGSSCSFMACSSGVKEFNLFWMLCWLGNTMTKVADEMNWHPTQCCNYVGFFPTRSSFKGFQRNIIKSKNYM